jgi:hypothetical protein
MMERCEPDCKFLLLYEFEFTGFCLFHNVQLNSTGFDALKCKHCLENRKVLTDVQKF